jgi:WD repeat-containing protein 68
VDTTCTLWNINTSQAVVQLIAHDKPVFDISFSSPEIFGTVGADGSLRVFDSRDLRSSNIVFETKKSVPLLRLMWNRLNKNYLITFGAFEKKIYVVDVRKPSVPCIELTNGHSGMLNSCYWAPNSSDHVCSVGDDGKAIIWELNSAKDNGHELFMYSSLGGINNFDWSRTNPEWIALACNSSVELIHL